MKGRPLLLLICWLGLMQAATADQTDPRLEGLFMDLRAAPGAPQSAPIERQIWSIWLETDDSRAEALLQSGVAAMRRGDNPAALDIFDQIVVVAPEFAEGWNKRATVHYMLGNLEASLVDIDRTLALEPRHFGALSGRGLVHIKLGDLENALLAFEAAIEIGPHLPGSRANIDAIRRALKQREI